MYDKIDLIKDTFITALNKEYQFMVQLVTLTTTTTTKKKTENKIPKTVSPEEFLKFHVDKDAKKYSMTFQLTNISGDIPKLQGSKIYNFSLTRIGEKRKRKMAEPIETVITCM